MKKAKIAEFKSKLSSYLKYVKKGESLTIYDRQTPIADVVPHNNSMNLCISESEGSLCELLKCLPKESKRKSRRSSLDLLLEDRKR